MNDQTLSSKSFYDRVSERAVEINRYPLALFAVCRLCSKRTDSLSLHRMDPAPRHAKDCPLAERPSDETCEQQPVAWRVKNGFGDWHFTTVKPHPAYTHLWEPLYAAHELKASEPRTAAEEWENAKAVMSGEMPLPPCECTLRDKAPSAYHNAKCPRFVAGKL